MKLLDYYQTLDSEEKKQLASEVAVELAYLRHIAHGRKKPGHSLARKIEAATDGKVSKRELRPDIWHPGES